MFASMGVERGWSLRTPGTKGAPTHASPEGICLAQEELWAFAMLR